MKNDGVVEQLHKKNVVCVKSVLMQEYSLEVPGSAAWSQSFVVPLIGKRMVFLERRG